ncbi:MATE family efflux transporter [Clostridium sp. NSJ-6]|uniref:Multidrug export protein MepA n=1 Tax=Clostridium hominis TaxID=2763036 RepID=A0ABR7DEZ3_9CLOT|nr:MATE family efflux transporter [Clostridium hominis]MBC5629712.1 MATE family efflux transporter [Clostridium hominis]
MEKKILRKFAKYVSLNILGMIGLSCYILADTFFISKALGANGLAALNFSISIYCIIQGLGLMIGIGGATRYTILRSKNRDKEAKKVFSNALTIGLIVSFILAIIGLIFSRKLSQILGADTDTINMSNVYLKTILCFSPFFISNNILLAFIRNDGDPRLSMTGMIVGSLSNIILDYIFIFPLSMGMFGAAFATCLAPIISIGVLSIHFIKRRNNFKLELIKPNFKIVSKIISLGMSSFITEVSSGVVLMVFNLIILNISGNIGVAAYGIVANISLVIIAIFTGIAQGMQPLVSEGYGKKNKELMNGVLKYSIILSVFISIVIYIVANIFSKEIVAIFNSENIAELTMLAINGIKIYFVGFIFVGINIISAAFLSGTSNVKPAFMISMLRGFVLLIPIAYILANIYNMNGVWISFVVAELLTFIVSVWKLYADKKVMNNKDL